MFDRPAASAARIAAVPASAAAAASTGTVNAPPSCRPVLAIDNQSLACRVSPVNPLPAAM